MILSVLALILLEFLNSPLAFQEAVQEWYKQSGLLSALLVFTPLIYVTQHTPDRKWPFNFKVTFCGRKPLWFLFQISVNGVHFNLLCLNLK